MGKAWFVAFFVGFAPLASPALVAQYTDDPQVETESFGGTIAPDPQDPIEVPVEQPEPGSVVKDELGIEWTFGPAEGRLGDEAKVAIPKGCQFTGAPGTKKFLEATNNLVGGREVGIVLHSGELGDGPDWWACFEFEKSGYVKDDEKDELDADAMLESMKEHDKEANKERARRKMPPLSIVDWAVPPHYDEESHNLEWGILLESPNGQGVNYWVKLLGRHGVMDASLVCAPEDLEAALPGFRELIAGYSYNPGKTYAEFTQGDPIAELGLSALIVGGAGVALWKTGLLAKLMKFIKLIAVVVLAGVAGLWKWISRRRARAST